MKDKSRESKNFNKPTKKSIHFDTPCPLQTMQAAQNEILAVFVCEEKGKKHLASADILTSIKHCLHKKCLSSSVLYEMVEIASLEYRQHALFSDFESDLSQPNEISQKLIFLTILHCNL